MNARGLPSGRARLSTCISPPKQQVATTRCAHPTSARPEAHDGATVGKGRTCLKGCRHDSRLCIVAVTTLVMFGYGLVSILTVIVIILVFVFCAITSIGIGI